MSHYIDPSHKLIIAIGSDHYIEFLYYIRICLQRGLYMNKYYISWYQPRYRMDRDDWIFVLSMIIVANLSIGLGLIIGFLIV